MRSTPPSFHARAFDLDRVRDHRRDDVQERLVGRVERDRLGALDHQDADELPERQARYRNTALRLGKAGHRNFTSGPDRAVIFERPAHGLRVLRHLAEVAEPDRRGARRGHPDDAVTDDDFRSDSLRRVPVAGNRVEPPPFLVEEQQRRMLVAEQLGEAVDRRTDDRVEVGAAVEPSGQLGELFGRAGSRCCVRDRARTVRHFCRPRTAPCRCGGHGTDRRSAV